MAGCHLRTVPCGRPLRPCHLPLRPLQRHVVESLLREIATEEARERLCEAGRWNQLLSEWQQQRQQQEQQPQAGVAAASSVFDTISQLAQGVPNQFQQLWGGCCGSGGGAAAQGLAATGEKEMKWLENVAREHGLSPQAVTTVTSVTTVTASPRRRVAGAHAHPHRRAVARSHLAAVPARHGTSLTAQNVPHGTERPSWHAATRSGT